MQLSNSLKTVLAKTLVVAGTTDITDALAVDTTGYEGVRFIFVMGAIVAGAVCSVGAAGKAANDPTPGTDDLAGSKQVVADTDDDSIYIVDVFQPAQRWVRPFVKRATQNVTVNAIIAELYGPRTKPVAKDASVHGQEIFVSPDVGTA